MNYFFEEVLESANKIFREHFLDDPVFRLVAILKSVNKIFEKQNPLKISTKSFKNISEKICILENWSVSTNKIFEIQL